MAQEETEVGRAFGQALEVAVDVGLVVECDVGGFLVGALHQASSSSSPGMNRSITRRVVFQPLMRRSQALLSDIFRITALAGFIVG